MNETVTIWDLSAAAYLLASGVEPAGVVGGRGRWKAIKFRNNDGRASQALSDWASGRAVVNVQQYEAARRQARELVAA